MVNLSTKERMLLEDEKSHEQLCVDKYNEYSNKAHCPELKNLFSQLAQKEQQHLDSINQLLNGIVPNINQQSGGQQNSSNQQLSSTYNTAIFEFRDKNVRQVLNHIQKEEQEHGEKIYNYMASHGMYQVQ